MVAHLHDVDFANAFAQAHGQAGVGGGGGVHLALHQRREVEQAGDYDGDIRFFQAGLMQHDQQVLARAAGQAVDADFLALEVSRLVDVGRFERDHIEDVLRINVVDGGQLFALVQRHEEGAGVGKGNVALAAQDVADGITTACAGQIGQLHALGLEEAFFRLHQDVGDFADGLAPAGQANLAQGRGGGHAGAGQSQTRQTREGSAGAEQAAAGDERSGVVHGLIADEVRNERGLRTGASRR